MTMDGQDYIHYLDEEGVPKRTFRVGSETEDGHTHLVHLRDDLPRATTTSTKPGQPFPHAHSIHGTTFENLTCDAGGYDNHIHSVIVEVTDA